MKVRERKRLPSARCRERETFRRAAITRLAEIALMPIDGAVSTLHPLKLRQLDTTRKACVDLLRALDREADREEDDDPDSSGDMTPNSAPDNTTNSAPEISPNNSPEIEGGDSSKQTEPNDPLHDSSEHINLIEGNVARFHPRIDKPAHLGVRSVQRSALDLMPQRPEHRIVQPNAPPGVFPRPCHSPK